MADPGFEEFQVCPQWHAKCPARGVMGHVPPPPQDNFCKLDALRLSLAEFVRLTTVQLTLAWLIINPCPYYGVYIEY